jgi:hypothetical protein
MRKILLLIILSFLASCEKGEFERENLHEIAGSDTSNLLLNLVVECNYCKITVSEPAKLNYSFIISKGRRFTFPVESGPIVLQGIYKGLENGDINFTAYRNGTKVWQLKVNAKKDRTGTFKTRIQTEVP